MGPDRPTRWGIVAVAIAAGVISATHMGKLPPALPELRQDLGLSLLVGGWLVSLFSVTGMCLGMVAGTFADKVGHRGLAVGGGLALAAGSLLGSVAPGGTALLATRFVEGLGFVAMIVALPALIAQVTRLADMRVAISVWGTYMPAGSTLAILLAPPLLDALGWRGLWQVVAALTLAGTLALAVVSRGAPRPRRAAPPGVLARNVVLTASRPGPWVLALCFAGYTIQWISLMVWLPTFLVEQRGLSTGLSGVLTALVVAMNIPGNLLSGWLLHRGVPRWRLLAVSGAAMGALALGIFSDAVPDIGRLLLCLAFSGIGGMIPAAVLAGAPVVAPGPGQIGTANGLLVQGSNLGQVVGPLLVAAAVAASGSWSAASGVMVAAATAIVLLALAVRRLEAAAQDGGGPERGRY